MCGKKHHREHFHTDEALTLDKIMAFKTTLAIPEADEIAETPVKRYCNTSKVPIRTQNQDGCAHAR